MGEIAAEVRSGGHFVDPSMEPLNLDGSDSVHDGYVKNRMDQIDDDFVDHLVREGKTGGGSSSSRMVHTASLFF